MEEDLEVEVQSEAASLREIAKNMNLKVGNTQDVDKLRSMIEAKKEPVQGVLSQGALKHKQKQDQYKQHMKLVRIRLTPMSVFERQLPSVTLDVGNSVVGNVHRTIQFNEPWHVEAILLNVLREKKFRAKKESVDPTTRRKIYSNVFHSSYGIELLPDLTMEELNKLAADQSAKHSID